MESENTASEREQAVTYWQVLHALVKEWKAEVEPGTSIGGLLRIIDEYASTGGVTSDSRAMDIACTIDGVLCAMDGARDSIAEMDESLAEYENVEDAARDFVLEDFLWALRPV